MTQGDVGYAAICEALAALPPHDRRRLVEIALESGYAAKDVAEMMQVSPPAVSRYTRGTLAPSPGALCRLLMSIDPSTRARLLVEATRSLWRLLNQLLDNMPPTPEAEALVEEIADTISEKMLHIHERRRA